MAVVVKCDGSDHFGIEPENGEHFTLDEMQDIVGGYIEMIRIPGLSNPEKEYFLVINEEGKFEPLARNESATIVYQGHYDTADYIVGDALFVSVDQLDNG